jgi:hypothetical protein
MRIPNRAQLSSSLSDARTWIRRQPWPRGEIGAPVRTPLLRFALACGLGVTSAVLVSCGSSGKGLIPAADAGPLRSDFEAVASDARAGGGSCAATEAALAQTEHDFNALPATIDSGLRERLEEGIKNLRTRALEMCAQPVAQTNATGTSAPTTTGTQTQSTTPTVTQTTTTQTAPPTTPTTTSTPGTGGGTPAPNQGEGEGEHHGNGNSHAGNGEGMGESKGGAGGEEAQGGGGGAGGREGGK